MRAFSFARDGRRSSRPASVAWRGKMSPGRCRRWTARHFDGRLYCRQRGDTRSAMQDAADIATQRQLLCATVAATPSIGQDVGHEEAMQHGDVAIDAMTHRAAADIRLFSAVEIGATEHQPRHHASV